MVEASLKRELVNNDLQDVMFNRHSVRQFDKSVKIDNAELQEMVAEATSAPSACNLQSWHFVVVNSETGREKAKSVMMPFNYPQVDSCSSMIFVLGDMQSHTVYRDVWNKACEEGKITPEKRDEIFKSFLPMYENATPQFLMADAMIDSSMVAMQLLLIIRAHGYEANPIAGYASDKVAATFDLDPKRYVPVMAIALGKATEKSFGSNRYDATTLTDFI